MIKTLQIRGTFPCACGERVAMFRILGADESTPWFVVCPSPTCKEPKTIRHATTFDEMAVEPLAADDAAQEPMRRRIAALLAKLGG
jgi:hypothetical protein